MSLTGQLDVFSLEEVLRLLARSSKSGCLRIGSPDLQGLVYFDAGSIALAMVGTEEEVQNSGLETTGPERLESHTVSDFFQEEVVESLYRIGQQVGAEFVFSVDVVPRHRPATSFDVELCVSGIDVRASEWADIESVIPSIDAPLRVSPETPNGEPVTLAPNTWRLVAAFAGEATIRTLADRLRIPRYRVAKDLTTLVRNGLVEVATGVGTFARFQEPTSSQPAAATPEPVAPPPDSYNQGWWTESVEPAVVGPTAEGPIGDADAEGPPDPFLDQVFSQLEETPEGQGSPDGTVAGFLKRRRMSSVGLDE